MFIRVKCLADRGTKTKVNFVPVVTAHPCLTCIDEQWVLTFFEVINHLFDKNYGHPPQKMHLDTTFAYSKVQQFTKLCLSSHG